MSKSKKTTPEKTGKEKTKHISVAEASKLPGNTIITSEAMERDPKQFEGNVIHGNH